MNALNECSKDQLITITRALHGTVGDTGRNNKEFYVNLLSTQYNDAALTMAADMVPVAAPAGAIGGDAVAKIIQGLQALIPPAGVDAAEVEAIVKRVVGEDGDINEMVTRKINDAMLGMQPRTIRTVVTAKTEVTLDEFTHPLFDDVIQLAGLRQNTLLVGPSGSGKTTLAAQIAKSLGLRYSAISCSAGMSESQLGGWLLPVGDDGRFTYVSASFVDLYENGGVFLLDELDALDGNAATFLNGALANGGFYIALRIGNHYVKRHPDFHCIAAANTFGHGGDMVYAGRERLDGATLDRFRAATLYMDYDEALEAKLIDAEVLAWGHALRAQIQTLKLRRILSTRVMIDFTTQKANLGWGVDKWERSYFADWTTDERRKVGR
jgi:energy-coupling factor transporter ATP-binding protein EcfA2